MTRRENGAISGHAQSNANLIQRASAGDDAAWRRLIDDYSGLVWSIVRTYGIGADGQEDVFQTVWLRLAENLDRIQDPERLAAWLARVTRNESVSVYRQRARVRPHDDLGLGEPTDLPGPGHAIEHDEQLSAVRAGLELISAQCRRLLSMLMAVPELSYQEIGELLEVPIGSIGPTRKRCLDQLRRTSPIRGISPPETTSGT